MPLSTKSVHFLQNPWVFLLKFIISKNNRCRDSSKISSISDILWPTSVWLAPNKKTLKKVWLLPLAWRGFHVRNFTNGHIHRPPPKSQGICAHALVGLQRLSWWKLLRGASWHRLGIGGLGYVIQWQLLDPPGMVLKLYEYLGNC